MDLEAAHDQLITEYKQLLKKHDLLSDDGELDKRVLELLVHEPSCTLKENYEFSKTHLLEFLINEYQEEHLKSEIVKLDDYYAHEYQTLIIAEYSPYLKKHRLLSHDGEKLDAQIKNLEYSVKDPFKFKIHLLKMLIRYGEEDLQDELDALEGKAGDELIDEEVAKQKRLAKRLSKLVEAEVEAKRQYYTESVKRFKEREIEILSFVEIGSMTQEEADKKLEEARRHTEQELKNISKRS